MKRCFITGVGGFLGSHLAEFLLSEGLAVYGTVHKDARNVEHIKDKPSLIPCDILDRKQVEMAVAQAQPQVVYHLAAQSLPLISWRDPQRTFETNVFGTLYLLEAVRDSGLDPTVVVASSSAVYGFSSPEEIPIKEDKVPQPTSPYGVSKTAADLLASVYHCAYAMKVIRVRPFLIIGPRKTGDACSDFARGIVEVERGRQRCLKVGNLEAVRDFLDVRDAVRALWLLADKGAPGEAYNLCSGQGHSLRETLETLTSMAINPVPAERDPARSRPSDEPVMVGDNSKLRALGWEPRILLKQSLVDVLAYWRDREHPFL